MKGSSDLLRTDASERQRQTLEHVLSEATAAKNKSVPVKKVAVAAARLESAQADVASSRETTRLLFISQDATLLTQTTQSLDGYLNLTDVFDEVHIVVLQLGLPVRNPVLRLGANVWMYSVSDTSELRLVEAAKQTIMQQMEFAAGFRADLIVARDPLLCGYLALWASRTYSRPAQLHVTEDFTQKAQFKKYRYPRVMSLLSHYVCKRFVSIRTTTDTLTEQLKKAYPHIKDIATLPRFYNFAAIAQGDMYFDIKQKYTQFSFIILYVGGLQHNAKAFQAIDSARNLMRSPKVGLVIMGDGEAATELSTRAKMLGISTQVVFEKSTADLYSYLKSADVLLIPDTDEQSDELAIKGAAAGIPIVMAQTETRLDLFTDGESALFFQNNDSIEMSNQMKKILNDLGVRTLLRHNALERVAEKLHEDPIAYKLAYRDSVEAALFSTEDSN